MRRDLGLSSGLGALHHMPFSADFTINTRGFACAASKLARETKAVALFRPKI